MCEVFGITVARVFYSIQRCVTLVCVDNAR